MLSPPQHLGAGTYLTVLPLVRRNVTSRSSGACGAFPSKTRIPAEPEEASEIRLEGWQTRKLQAALQAGRKNVKIQTLCAEGHLDRKVVLQWLKRHEGSDADRNTFAVRAGDTWEVPAEPVTRQKEEASLPGSSAGVAPRTQAPDFRQVESAAGPSAVQAPQRKVSRAVVDTLEMIYAKTTWPSNDVVMGVVDLHKVPRRQILDWFSEKRRRTSPGTRHIRKEDPTRRRWY